MSETQSYYPDLLGCGAFGASAVRLRDQEPPIFKPTDISGLVIWMDGNDNDAVVYDSLLLVTAWKNKGTLGGQFDLSGGIIKYGQSTLNGLNVVSFEANSYMSGVYSLNFQGRSMFFVARENSVPTNVANPWISSDTNGGMESFSLLDTSGNTTYFIGKHPSPIPELAFDASGSNLGYAVLTTFINGDLSDNYVALNGVAYPRIYDAVASGYNTGAITYFLGGYFGGSPIASVEDFAELLIYNTPLAQPDREEVESYLIRKWNLLNQPAPPVTFQPTDLSGCSLWFDATNGASIDLSGTFVSSLSNLGTYGNSATPADYSNVVYYDGSATMNGNTIFNFSQNAALTMPWANDSSGNNTVFVVCQPQAPLDASSNRIDFWNPVGENGYLQPGLGYYSPFSPPYFYAVAASGYYFVELGLSATDPSGQNLNINYLTSIDASNNQITLNGTALDLSFNNVASFNQYEKTHWIGNTGYNTSFWLAEIIIYTRLLSPSEITQVNTYLNDKWGITPLP